ncbi:hypothetical protein WDW89_05280 [Deltaproteobacteria bacterium TL4]
METCTLHIKRFFVLLILLQCCLPYEVFALFFERRTKPVDGENSYFFYPVAYTVPGFGAGAGLGWTATEVLGEGSDITLLHAEGDWAFDSAILTDLPLFTQHLTFSAVYADLYDGGANLYERGPDSSEEPVLKLELDRLLTRAAEVSLNLFESQLELYYGVALSLPLVKQLDFGNSEDPEATETRIYQFLLFLDLQRLFVTRKGFYLDDTDDRRDPHVGYRFQFEQYGFELEGNWKSYHVDDYSLTFFIPNEDDSAVWVFNAFYSEAVVTQPASLEGIDESRCLEQNEDLTEEQRQQCLVFIRAFNRFVKEEGNTADATSLGGLQRLRSYPQGRFHDSYSTFFGIEYRSYFLEGWNPFDLFIEKGVFNGLQLALFHEMGQVGPTNDQTLFENMKTSTGLGLRFLFSSVVVRFDYADGAEGSQTTAFIGYPF